jgi:hypothetical protein
LIICAYILSDRVMRMDRGQVVCDCDGIIPA